RGPCEGGIARVQMRKVADLIRTERAAATGVLRPTENSGLKKRTVHDELPAAFEQIEQAYLALRPLELVLFVHRHPRHPAAFCSQRIARVCKCLLLHKKLLARSLPFLLGYDWGCLHR